MIRVPAAIRAVGFLFLALSAGWDVMCAGPGSHRNPNIIVILADDMGYGDIHAFYPESGIPTPHLDRLAKEGIMFTDAHAPSAICTPTRYGLLTGRYSWRTRLKSGVLKGYDLPLIEEGRVTVADYLDSRGYLTGIVGKWHLGLEFQKREPGTVGEPAQFDLSKPLLHTPNKDGFDYSFVLPASLDFEPYLFVRNYDVVDTEFERVATTEFPRFWREGIKSKSFKFDQVLDDLLVEAKGFLERASEIDDPFFLYFPLTAPHKPLMPTEAFIGLSGKGLYGDFITQIDWTVGEILNSLKELGLEENTLVIFTSDNGSPIHTMNADTYPDHVTDETLDYYNESHHRANGRLRGIKGDMYEGGHRVPFMARWPAGIPPGLVTSETICLTDIFATIVEVTGGEKPAVSAEDSFSFAETMKGSGISRNRPAIIHHSGGVGMFAIRKGKWKLILGNGSGARTDPVGRPFAEPYQLYDLDHDLSEISNLVDQFPHLADELESRFHEIAGGGPVTEKDVPAFELFDQASLLWDGESTQGWRAIYQDDFPDTGWVVEDGQLICLGEELPDEERGGDIVTEKMFGSFDLFFEFKIQEGANSGIKYFVDERLKAGPGRGLGLEYAILDDDNFPYPDKDAKRTCGSLYDLVKAVPGATRPVGTWNHGRIVVRGNRIEHWLNGKKVVEVEKGSPRYRTLVANSKYRDIEGWGEFPRGHILIQDEGPRTAFRNIRIRTLDGDGSHPAPEQSFFNRKNLDGWQIENGVYSEVLDGKIRVSRGVGWLRSVKTFGDFTLIMEYRFQEGGANSGIFVRTAAEGSQDENGWPESGYQIQCRDTLEGEYPLGAMINYGGPQSEDDLGLEARKQAYRPTGEWHRFVIHCEADLLTVILNEKSSPVPTES